MYRTGKSYLLNRVIINSKKGEGFGVGPTINPCTKGLWMWATPLIGFTSEGERINVIVIDTEGIGGLDEDLNHDTQIFSLALLLSSFFVYNSMGSIDENAIQGLGFVTNMTKLIQVKSQECNAAEKTECDFQRQDITKFMPKFMWVVRDFSLQLVDDVGQEISQEDYLERALQEYDIKNTGEKSARFVKDQSEKNDIKKHIKQYFMQRDCCTLVRPTVDERNLQCLDTMKIEDLRSEFVEQAFAIRKKILEGITPKQINSCSVDGSMWIEMTQQYIDSMNSGQIPSIESSWTYILNQRALKLFEELKVKFEDGVKADIPFPTHERDLEQCIEYHSDKLLAEMQSTFAEDKEVIANYTDDIQTFLQTRSNELRSQNYQECRQTSQNTLTQLYQEVNQRLMADVSSQALTQNIKSLDFTLQEIQ